MKKFKGNQSLKIISGIYAGLAGAVLDEIPDTEMVELRIFGVWNDENIEKITWLDYSEVGEL